MSEELSTNSEILKLAEEAKKSDAYLQVASDHFNDNAVSQYKMICDYFKKYHDAGIHSLIYGPSTQCGNKYINFQTTFVDYLNGFDEHIYFYYEPTEKQLDLGYHMKEEIAYLLTNWNKFIDWFEPNLKEDLKSKIKHNKNRTIDLIEAAGKVV